MSYCVAIQIDEGIARDGPVGVIHFDAHGDTLDELLGNKVNHGTPFRRARPALYDARGRARPGGTKMTSALAAKTCTPCRGGIPPLGKSQSESYLKEAPGWTLVDDGRRLERRFAFRNFKEAMDFVAKVAALAESEGHHPDIAFGWGWASVSWQTKKIKGLHENDFIMAAKTNALAQG